MADTLQLTVKNRIDELEPAALAVGQFLDEHAIDPRAAYSVNLALEEMLTNIIKYGYDDAGEHEIVIRAAVAPQWARLTLEDDGHEFDPLAAPDPDTGADIAQRKIGGLGIHLVRRMVNAMRYRREHGRNILEIEVARGQDEELRSGGQEPVINNQ
jgi:anti-sigma regulatory factor (Ser/Thr protein kinase)